MAPIAAAGADDATSATGDAPSPFPTSTDDGRPHAYAPAPAAGACVGRQEGPDQKVLMEGRGGWGFGGGWEGGGKGRGGGNGSMFDVAIARWPIVRPGGW